MAIKNPRSILPLPQSWRTDDEKNFGRRLADAITELFRKLGRVSKGSDGMCPALPNETGTTKYLRQDGTWATPPKNTAGSTNTSSKIYLIGATSQAANPQTYSHDTCYVGPDGVLYTARTDGEAGSSPVVSSADVQAITGTKTFKNSSTAPSIRFMSTKQDDITGILYYSSTSSASTAYTSGRFVFRQYSPASDGASRTSHYEQFILPRVDPALSSTPDSYAILTSKEPVTIGQGGTGATSASGARGSLAVLHGNKTTGSWSTTTSPKITVPSSSRHFVIVHGGSSPRLWMGIIGASSTGSVFVVEIFSGSNISKYTTSTNGITFTQSSSTNNYVLTDMVLAGNELTM